MKECSFWAQLDPKCFLIAKSFENCIKIYYKSPFLQCFVKPPSKRTQKTLLTAAQNAEAAGVSCQIYVLAQFWWFHKHFSKPPALYQLAYGGKYSPIDRVNAYLRENKQEPTITNKSQPAPRKDKAFVFESCQARLDKMVQSYNKTDKEIFKCFKNGTLETFFDPEWLNENKSYQELKANGEL